MIIATVMVCTLPLSGCEGLSIPVTARDNLYSALNLRVTANINIANELYKAGLINQTTLENVTAYLKHEPLVNEVKCEG